MKWSEIENLKEGDLVTLSKKHSKWQGILFELDRIEYGKRIYAVLRLAGSADLGWRKTVDAQDLQRYEP